MDLVKAIHDVFNSTIEKRRNYIGASQAGKACSRAIWYSISVERQEAPPQRKIIFEVGKYLERMIVSALSKSSSLSITEPCEENDFLFVKDDIAGFEGHVDGLLSCHETGETFVLEIKTANDDNFNKFKKEGLLSWAPYYYSQVQCYLGMLKVERGILLAINKNNGELHQEIVHYDDIFYHQLKSKVKHILSLTEPPEKLNKNPQYYICRMCEFKDICHEPS